MQKQSSKSLWTSGCSQNFIFWFSCCLMFLEHATFRFVFGIQWQESSWEELCQATPNGSRVSAGNQCICQCLLCRHPSFYETTPFVFNLIREGYCLFVQKETSRIFLFFRDPESRYLASSSKVSSLLCEPTGFFTRRKSASTSKSLLQDATIRIWDTALSQCLIVLSSHLQSVTCLKWGGTGLIYSCSQDRTIKVWRGQDVSSLLVRCLRQVISLSLHFDSQENVCVFWQGVLCRTLQGHGHWVNTMALSTDYVLRTAAFDSAAPSLVQQESNATGTRRTDTLGCCFVFLCHPEQMHFSSFVKQNHRKHWRWPFVRSVKFTVRTFVHECAAIEQLILSYEAEDLAKKAESKYLAVKVKRSWNHREYFVFKRKGSTTWQCSSASYSFLLCRAVIQRGSFPDRMILQCFCGIQNRTKNQLRGWPDISNWSMKCSSRQTRDWSRALRSTSLWNCGMEKLERKFVWNVNENWKPTNDILSKNSKEQLALWQFYFYDWPSCVLQIFGHVARSCAESVPGGLVCRQSTSVQWQCRLHSETVERQDQEVALWFARPCWWGTVYFSKRKRTVQIIRTFVWHSPVFPRTEKRLGCSCTDLFVSSTFLHRFMQLTGVLMVKESQVEERTKFWSCKWCGREWSENASELFSWGKTFSATLQQEPDISIIFFFRWRQWAKPIECGKCHVGPALLRFREKNKWTHTPTCCLWRLQDQFGSWGVKT